MAGVPIVEGLVVDRIELAGAPYMDRFFVRGDVRALAGSVRYHHIMASDSGRDLHDHPWDFTSTILDGRYVETTSDGDREYGPGDVLVRRAEDLHRLTLPAGPVWTLVETGPSRRRWGFQTEWGWMPAPRKRRRSREW